LSIHDCRKKTRCIHRNGIIISFWVDMSLPVIFENVFLLRRGSNSFDRRWYF
jgi:hypothetical protein